MTELEQFKAMLLRAGVMYTPTVLENNEGTKISIYGSDGPKNEGYTDFVAEFWFDAAGSLESTGVWE